MTWWTERLHSHIGVEWNLIVLSWRLFNLIQLIKNFQLSVYLYRRIKIIRWRGIFDVCDNGDFLVEITVEVAEMGKKDAKRKEGSSKEEKKEKEEWKRRRERGKGGQATKTKKKGIEKDKNNGRNRSQSVGGSVGHLLISIIIRISFWVFVWVILSLSLRLPFELPCYLLLLFLFFYWGGLEAEASLWVVIMLVCDQMECIDEWEEKLERRERGRGGSGHTLERKH